MLTGLSSSMATRPLHAPPPPSNTSALTAPARGCFRNWVNAERQPLRPARRRVSPHQPGLAVCRWILRSALADQRHGRHLRRRHARSIFFDLAERPLQRRQATWRPDVVSRTTAPTSSMPWRASIIATPPLLDSRILGWHDQRRRNQLLGSLRSRLAQRRSPRRSASRRHRWLPHLARARLVQRASWWLLEQVLGIVPTEAGFKKPPFVLTSSISTGHAAPNPRRAA